MAVSAYSQPFMLHNNTLNFSFPIEIKAADLIVSEMSQAVWKPTWQKDEIQSHIKGQVLGRPAPALLWWFTCLFIHSFIQLCALRACSASGPVLGTGNREGPAPAGMWPHADSEPHVACFSSQLQGLEWRPTPALCLGLQTSILSAHISQSVCQWGMLDNRYWS